jgi:putative FmdB family regulatory protein
MPIFDYKCADCGAAFEKLVRRDETVTCPKCNSASVAKQLSVCAVHGVWSSHDQACATCNGGKDCSTCPHNT